MNDAGEGMRVGSIYTGKADFEQGLDSDRS